VWLAAGLVAGVLAQILLGGLVVLFDLSPRLVMGHFLL
jgi:heme A synthase